MPHTRKSVAEILGSGVTVRPHEAVAIVQGMCAQLPKPNNGTAYAVRDLGSAFLSKGGAITVLDPMAVSPRDAVEQNARLLAQILLADLQQAFEYADDSRAAIADVVENAANGKYASVQLLVQALGRFDKHWEVEFLRGLFDRASGHRPSFSKQTVPVESTDSVAAPPASVPAAEALNDVEAPKGSGVVQESSVEPLNRPAPATELNVEEQPVLSSPTVGVAEKYRLTRENAGISLDDIAQRSKIPLHLLQAIEAGDFGSIPSGIYGRAYFRTYAKELGLDPDEVLREVLGFLRKDEALDEIRSVLLQDDAPAAPQPRSWRKRNREAMDDQGGGGVHRLLLSAAALICAIGVLTAWSNLGARGASQAAPLADVTVTTAEVPMPSTADTSGSPTQEAIALYAGPGLPPPPADPIPVATSGTGPRGDIYLAPPPPAPAPPSSSRSVRVRRTAAPRSKPDGNVFRKFGTGIKKLFTAGSDQPSSKHD